MLDSVHCLSITLKTLHSILGGGREKRGDRVRGENKEFKEISPKTEQHKSRKGKGEAGEREKLKIGFQKV